METSKSYMSSEHSVAIKHCEVHLHWSVTTIKECYRGTLLDYNLDINKNVFSFIISFSYPNAPILVFILKCLIYKLNRTNN